MLASVRIVLVNTSHPGNIGGVARAMKNMAISKLVLVDPKEFPSEKATARASGATDILESAEVVSTLEQALEGCQLVVGASARSRHIPWPVVNPREMAQQVAAVQKESDAAVEVALVFGREDRGLTNEELHRCHRHVHIPSNPDFSSLNLAAAVQVICYELRMAALAEDPASELNDVSRWGTAWDIESATSDELERFFEHLEQALIEIDFLDPDNPRQLMTRLRRLYMRSHPDKVEIGILRGILTATQKVQKQGGDHV
ncbi:tRNA (cytosine(32)/uridine(32)-2'-O)-methyltransferase TrmJ [Motiliproteus coralliicola]|uniref:tRNA (cytidine/uridine-2'-O-)-methyltransferase TrmJ n=1 Tax=Motiliproteus coralliicola TaxID=2283196 RepID=A0A369WD01_9GAMM|nr:tRNA (cytosine(32)/uridine(32)-2'-O)-methyltransferase TrmJ [Motiliproteus coralliicola]RDE19622.1 tRNA (cytosine(32)/uridine(32)-2'-O)-methyltransferase TrmJ [Motiliproteus coralliicola]